MWAGGAFLLEMTMRPTDWLKSALCVLIVVPLVGPMWGCASSTKIEPAKAHAERVIDHGEVVIEAIVYPRDSRPQRPTAAERTGMVRR